LEDPHEQIYLSLLIKYLAWDYAAFTGLIRDDISILVEVVQIWIHSYLTLFGYPSATGLWCALRTNVAEGQIFSDWIFPSAELIWNTAVLCYGFVN
jgi:hypothetical protein